jgi:hypothetical protein
VASSKASTVKEHCDANYLCDQEGVDAAASGRVLSPLSTVTLIAGATLAGVGVWLYVVSAKGHEPPSSALVNALQFRGTF